MARIEAWLVFIASALVPAETGLRLETAHAATAEELAAQDAGEADLAQEPAAAKEPAAQRTAAKREKTGEETMEKSVGHKVGKADPWNAKDPWTRGGASGNERSASPRPNNARKAVTSPPWKSHARPWREKSGDNSVSGWHQDNWQTPGRRRDRDSGWQRGAKQYGREKPAVPLTGAKWFPLTASGAVDSKRAAKKSGAVLAREARAQARRSEPRVDLLQPSAVTNEEAERKQAASEKPYRSSCKAASEDASTASSSAAKVEENAGGETKQEEATVATAEAETADAASNEDKEIAEEDERRNRREKEKKERKQNEVKEKCYDRAFRGVAHGVRGKVGVEVLFESWMKAAKAAKALRVPKAAVPRETAQQDTAWSCKICKTVWQPEIPALSFCMQCGAARISDDFKGDEDDAALEAAFQGEEARRRLSADCGA